MANPYTLCFRIALLEVDATTVQVVFRDRNDGGRGQCPPLRMHYGLTCLAIVASVKPVGVCSNPTLVDWRNSALIRVSYVSPNCDELLHLIVPGRPQTSTDDWRMSVLGKDIDIRSAEGFANSEFVGASFWIQQFWQQHFWQQSWKSESIILKVATVMYATFACHIMVCSPILNFGAYSLEQGGRQFESVSRWGASWNRKKAPKQSCNLTTDAPIASLGAWNHKIQDLICHQKRRWSCRT